MSKLKLGMYWAASCGGCEISLLEIHEKILDLLELADVVFWPCIMDFKYHDVEAMPDGAIDVCFFNGAIRTEENERIAKLLRRKSRVLVSYGACSMLGGIPGLANLFSREEIFDRVYRTTESTDNPDGIYPELKTEIASGRASGRASGSASGRELELPGFYPKAKALHQVVKADYFMPGCPPVSKQTWAVCQAIASGELPPPGSVVGAGDKSVCDECGLEKKGVKIKEFKRPHEVVPDGKSCLLEQGIVCLGPATRSGCEAQCLSVNMPCRGCYGPAGDTVDVGGGMIGLIGSLLDTDDEFEIRKAIDQIVDPAGSFYRFSMPTSTLARSRG